jgi:hypothetical protein
MQVYPIVIIVNVFLTWIQDRAYEPAQKYKEGKYILERNLLIDVTDRGV